jgi:putative drug exporter of the RND superfamily
LVIALATTEDRPIPSAMPTGEPDIARPSKLYRWGVAVALHRRLALSVSALVLLLCAVAYPSLQKALGPPDYQLKGSESAQVEQLLERRFPALGSEDDALVLYSPRHLASDRVFRHAIALAVAAMRRQDGVRTVLGPYDYTAVGQIASDEHAAFIGVALTGDANRRFNRTAALQDVATRAVGASGVRAWLTGYSPIARDLTDVEKTDTARAERIGLPVALLILLLATGAPIAAMLPVLLALSGLILTYGVLALLAIVFHFDGLLLAVVAMIGLGIGLDYALFIVSRFREELARAGEGAREGEGEGDPRARDDEGDPRDSSTRVAHAIGVTLTTSGRTILFSGVIVALSLASVFVVNAAIFREIAIGAVVVVTCMLIVAITLLPALLAWLGPRINSGALSKRLQPANTRPGARPGRPSAWARWAQLMMRHPIPAIAVAVTLLVVATMPAFGLRYGINVGVLSLTTTNSGQGEKVLSESFAPGVVAPVQVVVSGGHPGKGAGSNFAGAQALTRDLEHDERVTGVLERRSKFGVLLAAVLSVPIDSLAGTSVVRHIRGDLAPRIHADGGQTVLVGGSTAQAVDIADEMHSKFPLVLGLILGLALLFLLVVFRSVVLPIKAVFMNLLVTGATIGLLVYVFQEGHGERLLDFTSTGYIQALLPLTVFALLFGLSMDYEVFLIRRMQEEWRETHDNRLAVVGGIEHTARPISTAAAIMVVIFGSFMAADLLELKQTGFALAVAIALDATLVRFVLVPALMRLFGKWNWWLPAALRRVLPDVGND